VDERMEDIATFFSLPKEIFSFFKDEIEGVNRK